jgi:hypothetical protein
VAEEELGAGVAPGDADDAPTELGLQLTPSDGLQQMGIGAQIEESLPISRRKL